MTENLNSCRVYDIMQSILKKDLPILDIGDRVGSTGYIDIIKNNEIIYPVMKGKYYINRPFIVIKCILDSF